MLKHFFQRLPIIKIVMGITTLLILVYVGLIAIVMSYAAMHVEFAEQVRSDEATVARLESAYLNSIGVIAAIDYENVGYTKPLAKSFVPGPAATALTVQ